MERALARRGPWTSIAVAPSEYDNTSTLVTVAAEAATSPSQCLVEHRLDVALVAGERKADPRIVVAPLFRDELVALVGQEHPWFGRSMVPVRALRDEHVWVDDGAFRRGTPLARALVEAGDVTPRKVTCVPISAGAAIEVARANLGITVVPRWAVEPALAGGDLHVVRLGARGVWLNWSAATRAERPDPPLAAFLEALKTHHPRARPGPSRAATKRRAS